MKSVLSAAFLAVTSFAVAVAGPTPAERGAGTATNALALWQESGRLFKAGQYARCLATCTSLVELPMTLAELEATAGADLVPETLFRRAACLVALGDREKAVNQYMEVENFFPKYRPRAALGAALVYRTQEDRQSFVTLLRRVLKIYPRSIEATAAWYMHEWEVRKGYVWPDYTKPGKNRTAGMPPDMFDMLYGAALTEIAPPGHYHRDDFHDKREREFAAESGRSMWEFCLKSPGTFDTYWDKSSTRAEEMSNKFRNLLKEKPDSAYRDLILAAIGMLETVSNGSTKPNQVPEDTARKLADPQH